MYSSIVGGDVATAGHSNEEVQWYLSILKGVTPGSDCNEGDSISTVQFNECGDMIATGDKLGRIVLFKRIEVEMSAIDDSLSPYPPTMDYYSVYCSFTAHEPEFDYLKSLEIDERVNNIEFLKGYRQHESILTCNDKTIKLWRLRERRFVAEGEFAAEQLGHGGFLELPKLRRLQEPHVSPVLKVVYKNGHMYHLNSISLFADGELFLSSDDLRVNCWHLDYDNELFQIVDLKPRNMENLTEVITASTCHPHYSHLFAFSSSKGILRLCDMRTQALCDRTFVAFEQPDDTRFPRGFFSEIIGSMSDVKFGKPGDVRGGHDFLMATRDYLTVKVWDSRQNSRPLEIYNVHEHVKPLLCTLYENDSIFDKFDCSFSPDDRHIVTGSYGHLFSCINRNTQNVSIYEASADNASYANQLLTDKRNGGTSPSVSLTSGPMNANVATLTPPNAVSYSSNSTNNNSSETYRRRRIKLTESDFNRRVMHCAFSPRGDTMAIAATANLFIYANHSHLMSRLSTTTATTTTTTTATNTPISSSSSSSLPSSPLITPVLLHPSSLNYLNHPMNGSGGDSQHDTKSF
ncbi:hypothetical protein ACOME3_008683 [Neoechinorhynchus agilis]